MQMRSIGIMGGTFDPIHYGHLLVAEEARWRLRLERVLFIPVGQPAHKKNYDVSPAERRHAMALLATNSNPHFECSRIEVDRPGPSYSVDTLEELRSIHGDKVEFDFITGADEILDILTWRHPDRLLSMCRLIAVTRPGYDLGDLAKRLPAGFLERIETLELPGVNISSTEIRSRVRKGLPIAYMVPECVERYIRKHELYGGQC